MPTLPILPDWLPPWVQIAVTAAAVLLLLMFAAMPFSVFGVKGRLDLIEARLDEIQGEIRNLALRLPEPDDEAGQMMRPPIPPATAHGAGPRGRAPRQEPRFD